MNKRPWDPERPADREALIQYAHRQVQAHRPDLDIGRCLYLSHFAATYLHDRCAPDTVLLQAGTLQWQFIPDALDDGGVNAFSFVYTGGATARAMLGLGQLPEMHVWVALRQPGRDWLIDLATGELLHWVEKTLGLTWQGDPPPSYLIHPVPPPSDADYRPDREACILALCACLDLFGSLSYVPRKLQRQLLQARPHLLNRRTHA